MPRILFLHPSDEFYGADRVLLQTVKALKSGFQLSVWLPTDIAYPKAQLSRRLEAMDVPVHFVNLPVLRRSSLRVSAVPNLVSRVLLLGRELRRNSPSILYVNTSAMLLALLAVPARTRVIVHIHEDLSGLEGAVLRLLLLRANALIAVSEAVAARLGPRLRRRTRVVYNGFAEPRPSESNRQGHDRRGPRILLASRWNTWKGHQEFLAAWATVRRKDIHLVILGAAPPSGQSVDVSTIVARLPNSATVSILGEQTDMGPHLEWADVVVVPSVKPDPLPTIAIEAMSYGRAVYASDLGGLPEIVDHNRTGLLIPPTDRRAWAAAMDAIDTKRAKEMGGAGLLRFRTRFSEEAYSTILGEVVQKVADDQRLK